VTDFRSEDRVVPPLAGDEATTVKAFLDYQRDTFRWKVSGLSADQLTRSLAPTTMTLGGLVAHLAVDEAYWLNQVFGGGVEKPSWFDAIDDDEDDWSFQMAADASREQLFGWFDQSIRVSDQVIAAALAGPDGLGALSAETIDDGQHVSLRWILCHLIEEYARHNGHADLLRESIDGSTGE
jgi:uncharacterized damage-inducible protein DinB